jgi:hypothetical protein
MTYGLDTFVDHESTDQALGDAAITGGLGLVGGSLGRGGVKFLKPSNLVRKPIWNPVAAVKAAGNRELGGAALGTYAGRHFPAHSGNSGSSSGTSATTPVRWVGDAGGTDFQTFQPGGGFVAEPTDIPPNSQVDNSVQGFATLARTALLSGGAAAPNPPAAG